MRELEEGVVYLCLGVAQRFEADLTRTKQCVERKYITRTREVWGSMIDMRRKFEAQNTWGAGVLRYSLGTSNWTRSDTKELDRSTRRIMKQSQAHQYGASVARLYLPRSEGGRGLVCLEHARETETLSTTIYLHSNSNPQVSQAMRYMEQVANTNTNSLVAHSLRIGKKYKLANLLPAYRCNGWNTNPTKITNMVNVRQKQIFE